MTMDPRLGFQGSKWTRERVVPVTVPLTGPFSALPSANVKRGGEGAKVCRARAQDGPTSAKWIPERLQILF